MLFIVSIGVCRQKARRCIYPLISKRLYIGLS